MRSFLGDYIFGGFWTTRREIGAERTTNTHVLGKGRPGEKVGVERTTRTEYALIIIGIAIGGIPRDSVILIALLSTIRRKVHIFRVQPHPTGWRCTRLEVRENQAGASSAGWVKGELLPLTSES